MLCSFLYWYVLDEMKDKHDEEIKALKVNNFITTT